MDMKSEIFVLSQFENYEKQKVIIWEKCLCSMKNFQVPYSGIIRNSLAGAVVYERLIFWEVKWSNTF